MILIDGIFVHNGGGKILLDYLIEKLEHSKIKVFYLLDERIRDKIKVKKTNQVEYLHSSIQTRMEFYKNHKNNFEKIFILGNIPPQIKMSATVYCYFHNTIYIDVPKDFSLIDKIKYKLKIFVIKYYSKNVDKWLFQTELVKSQFGKKFGQSKKSIVLPFFPSIIDNQNNSELEKTIRKEFNFLYVSNAQSNKNHKRLIKAFCESYDILKKGKLIVTVSEDYPDILNIIQNAQRKSYPVINLGFLDRQLLIKVYKSCNFVIFPSLSESFGLGIIEGISLGCKIIGADLPYTYAICNPSLTFNPFEVNDIRNAFLISISNNLKRSSSSVNCEIDLLLKLLG